MIVTKYLADLAETIQFKTRKRPTTPPPASERSLLESGLWPALDAEKILGRKIDR